MIREILARIPHPEPDQPPRRICVTVPAAPLGGEDTLTYHEATLRQMPGDMGFEPPVSMRAWQWSKANWKAPTTPVSA
jgi:hypothetical protein